MSKGEQLESFRRRQQEDIKRFDMDSMQSIRQRPFKERYSSGNGSQETHTGDVSGGEGSSSGEEAWRDSEGDRLDDFGVDEDIEFYDEDDVPLAEILRRRRGKGNP